MTNKRITLAYLLNTVVLKWLLILTVVFSIFAGYLFGNLYPNTIDSMLCLFSTSWNLVFIFLIITIVAIHVTSTLEKMSILKIRLHSKKTEFSLIAKYVIICTLLFASIFVFVQCLTSICANGIIIDKTIQSGYGIPKFYFIFYIIRYFIVLSLFAILISSIKYKLNQYFVIIPTTILLFLLWTYHYDYNTIVNTLLNMKWFIGYYFEIISYGSFFTEIYCSCAFIIVMCLAYLLIQQLFWNPNSLNITTLKIILIDDFFTIIRKHKKYLLTFFLVVTSFVIYRTISGYIYNIDNVYFVLGLKIEKEMDPIILFLFLIYLTTFIYISFSLFIKDILYRIDTYFIRMKVSSWYLYKTLSIIILTFLIKAVYYIIFCFIMSRVLTLNTHLFTYFIYDLFLTLLIEQALLILYFEDIKLKILWVIGMILILFMCGISIINFTYYNVILILIALSLSILTMFISCKNHKNLLFERVIKNESRS